MGEHRGGDHGRNYRYDDREYEGGRGGGGYRGGRTPPAGRIYVGNLPAECDRKSLEEVFGKYGPFAEISVKRTISGTPFAFIEYEDPRDADDAIRGRDGYTLDGNRLRVEIPFAARGGGGGGGPHGGGRPFGGPGGGRGPMNRGPPRRGEFRVLVKGLPPSGSWQDLKDHMRDAGECVYADVFRDGTGMVEYAREEDMEYAIKTFDDSRFTSHEGESSRINVCRAPDSNPRDDPRDSYGGGGGRGGGDYHHRGGGGGGRSRSRSFDRRGPPPSSSSDYRREAGHNSDGGGGGGDEGRGGEVRRGRAPRSVSRGRRSSASYDAVRRRSRSKSPSGRAESWRRDD